MRVWQNDDLVIDATGITLPREDSIYNRLEVGITANGDEVNSHVVYIDDVRVWDRAPAWWLSFNNDVPALSAWGLVAMTLLFLVVGALVVSRQSGSRHILPKSPRSRSCRSRFVSDCAGTVALDRTETLQDRPR